MNTDIKIKMVALSLSLSLAIAGAGAIAGSAYATEITGTLGTSGGSSAGSGSATTTDSSPSAPPGTVVGGTPEGGQTSGSGSSASSAGSPSSSSAASMSGHSHAGYAPAAVQSDGSLAKASDYTGTGGGYDPNLDTYLATLGPQGSAGSGSGDSAIAARDALAYNHALGAQAPRASVDNLAGAAASDSRSQMIVLILAGLAVAALAGYAVNAYMAYRNEKGL